MATQHLALSQKVTIRNEQGEEIVPEPGEQAVLCGISKSGKIEVSGFLNPPAAEGEGWTADSDLAAEIARCAKTGTIYVELPDQDRRNMKGTVVLYDREVPANINRGLWRRGNSKSNGQAKGETSDKSRSKARSLFRGVGS
jgi:hypothetical protein